MIARDILPSGQLIDYIEKYRIRHFVFKDSIIPPVKPFPPRPEQTLTFYIRGSETTRHLRPGFEIKKPRSVVSGQFTYRVDRYVSYPEILMIIVDLKPGALYRLTGISLSTFVNKDLDAETIFPPEVRRVNDRLSSCESYFEMIQIIEGFFLYLIGKTKSEFLPVDRILIMVAHEPEYSVDWVARHAYLSPRQLERKFEERIGICPKTFLRIARFNQSYWLHLKYPGLSWTEIAFSCGYTDYHHLAKEYKEFSNTTPIHFFIEESKAPGRMLGLNKYR